jgi:hypothetical protein
MESHQIASDTSAAREEWTAAKTHTLSELRHAEEVFDEAKLFRNLLSTNWRCKGKGTQFRLRQFNAPWNNTSQLPRDPFVKKVVEVVGAYFVRGN